MLNQKLQIKVLVGALFLVFAVCTALTVVVSIIITKQNKALFRADMEGALTVIQDSLFDKQQSMAGTISQMATMNKMGDDIKFLMGFKDSGLDMARQSYEKIGNAIANTAILENFHRILVYTKEGRLNNYFLRNDDGNFLMGFQYGPKLHYRSFKKGEQYNQIDYTEADNIDGISLKKDYGSKIPDRQIISLDRSDEFLSIKVSTPIYANAYNKKNQKVESVQIGVIFSEERISKKFVEQMDRITGMKMNVFVGNVFSAGDFAQYKSIDTTSVLDSVDSSWKIENQTGYFSSIIIQDQGYFQILLPFYANGGFIGGLTILQSDEAVKANTKQMIAIIGVVAAICMLLVIPLAYVAARKLVRPLIDIVEKLQDIAEGDGDLTNRLKVTSKDEVGQVAKWFNSFIDKIHKLISDVAKNAEELNGSSSTLEKISKTMAQGAENTSQKANSVSASGEELSGNMASVASAMEQASSNMGTVAAATEEMTNTISEISKNTVQAKKITEEVVVTTDTASEQIKELGLAAEKINHVVGVITDISSQVDLLALNATIEAARAGDAGKGFAVVANEIKDLATQTADATSEIKGTVETITLSTGNTIDQIGSISDVVAKVDDIVVIIASAIEEQSVTTQNISENIAQITEGIDQISNNVSQSSQVSTQIASDITSVTQTANQMTDNSSQVDGRAKDLSGLSEELMKLVNKFKI